MVRATDGWSIVSPAWGDHGGLRAHRGTLHPDEYVDRGRLVALLEEELGYTLTQLHSVYSTGGRIPNSRRELRGRIDARLLALATAGGNMTMFARVTGLNETTLDRALVRARRGMS